MPPKKRLIPPAWQSKISAKLFKAETRKVLKDDEDSTIVKDDSGSTIVKDDSGSTSTIVKEEVGSTIVNDDSGSMIVKEEIRSTIVKDDKNNICPDARPGTSTQKESVSTEGASTSKSATDTRKKTQKYHPVWEKIYPWLSYNNNMMFCKLCLNAGKNNTMTIGCQTFKTSSLKRHEMSQEHQLARDAPLHAQEMQQAMDNAVSEEEEAITIATKVVYWMAKEDIALSKYESLLGLLAELKVDTIKVLKISDRVNYASYYSANELLKAIDSQIDTEVQEKLDNSPNITILADESTDITNKKRMTLNARIVIPETCKTETVFLRDVEYIDGTGEGLSNIINEELKRRNIQKKFTGLGTDGANVMSGADRGVYGRLKAVNPHLVHVHCMAHRLALCTSQAAKDIPAFNAYQDWFTSLFYYFKRSSSRATEMREIQKILESPQLKYREVHAVRWLSFYEALTAVFRTLEPLIVYFESRKRQKDPKAAGLLKKLLTNEFFFITYMLMDVLAIVSKLCLILQKKDLDVAYSKVAIESCIKDLEAYKVGEQLAFPTFLEKFPSHVVSHSESGRLEYKGHTLTNSNTNLDLLKSKFLNKLLSNIRSRFPMISLISAFHIFGMRPVSVVEDGLDDWGNADLEDILKHYGQTQTFKNKTSEPMVPKSEVRQEWLLVKRCVKAMKYPTDDMAKLWGLIVQNHKDDFPNLLKLAYIALTAPLHTAECERTFSVQNQILTSKRNRLTSVISDRLIRVKLEGKGLKGHNFNATVEHWRRAKSRILKLK